MEKERNEQHSKYRNAGQVCHSTIDITVSYECPECEWKHYLSPMQYLYKGYVVVCDCGTVFKPINPKIGYTEQTETKNNDLDAAISILTSQGFSESEIKKAALKTNISGNIDNMITSILQNL